MFLLNAITQELNLLMALCGGILLIGLVLKRLKQPYILAYILCGILLGPHGMEIVTDYEVTERLGEIGLIILMFFIGMEISLPDFVRKWRIALLGTGMQILFSLLAVLVLGFFMGWAANRIVLLGFIISISSSAVVIKLVEESGRKAELISRNVISILLTQDILIVPMMVILALMGGEAIDVGEISLQAAGGLLVVASMIYLLWKKEIRLPFAEMLENDHELQVFASLIVCFGFALLTSLFGLSPSLGALVSGMFINASPSSRWLHESLHSFRIVLVSVFFVSIGMLINLDFLMQHWVPISLLVLLVYGSNHGINTLSLRFLGNDWRESIFGGALLAQIGEFSFVFASIGNSSNILSSFEYQATIIVIAITIFISPFWVLFTRKLVRY